PAAGTVWVSDVVDTSDSRHSGVSTENVARATLSPFCATGSETPADGETVLRRVIVRGDPVSLQDWPAAMVTRTTFVDPLAISGIGKDAVVPGVTDGTGPGPLTSTASTMRAPSPRS